MDRPLATDVESPGAEALLAHPQMRELIAARRRFFVVAWSVFLAAAVLLFGGAAVVPGALGVALVDGVSVGVVLSCAFVALIFVLTVAYARRARAWDRLVAQLRGVAGYPSIAEGSERAR
jgi:uncharacterized membrane protein (DUF485 family)